MNEPTLKEISRELPKLENSWWRPRIGWLMSTLQEREAELESIRLALKGYRDSDLGSLAETVMLLKEQAEAGLAKAQARIEHLEDLIRGYIESK